MNVSELRDALNVEREDEHLVPLGDLEYRNGALRHADWSCQIDDHGLRKLGRHIGVPISYLEKCPPGLREANINYWLTDKPDAEARIHILDGLLVGINPREKTPLGVADVADAITSALDPDDEVTGHQFDGDMLVIETAPDGYSLLGEGEALYDGVRVIAHPHISAPPTVEFLLRWAGGSSIAIAPEWGLVPLRDTIAGVRESLAEAIARTVGSAPEYVDAIIETCRSPLNLPAEDTIDQIDRTYRLSKKVTRHLHSLALEGEPETGYELLRLIADAAEAPMVGKTRRQLQHIAGALLADPTHDPRTCYHCKKRDTPRWAR